MKTINIKYPTKYRTLAIGELKKVVIADFNKRLDLKRVKNKATGTIIILNKSGAKHALFARTSGFEKIIVLTAIDKIIEQSEYVDVKKTTKSKDLFMMVLKQKAEIDGEKFEVTVFVRGTNRGEFYYDHALIK